MRIALTGMSGVGKTYWANRLSEAGFTCWHCDDLIAAKLSAELKEALVTLSDMGRWMGLPNEAGYREKEEYHVACEEQVMQQIVTDLSRDEGLPDKLVIDLSGSAIYVSAAVWTALRSCARVVYLTTSHEVLENMAAEYVRDPGPLIWGGLFRPHLHETFSSCAARCYRDLVAFREQLYKQLSHVTVDYQLHRRSGLTIERFLWEVSGPAPKVPQFSAHGASPKTLAARNELGQDAALLQPQEQFT